MAPTTAQPVNEATLLYVRSGVDLAVMPGSESGVMFGSEAAGRVSSNEVFVAGTSLLAAHAFGHEAERLSQIEQVFVAALETGRIDDAAIRLNDLEKEFPTTTNKDGNIVFASLRVAKLQGMLLEAKAEFDKALALYEKALAQNETYAPIIKRKVAVLIDQ
ncbi:ER membrane complex subunit 2, partial [Rhizoclosmatium hyalinum]